ncbi:MAG: peptidase T [Planctomycetes bacterium]|nr:peptidase T [Planctomycetota bacterium]MBL7044404.1 peptidase T [Pirellulaceae bacterium]
MNAERLLDRFLQYVAIDTTANDANDGYPSSEGQWELGRLLVGQLTEIGLDDVHQDEHGLVWATIAPTTDKDAPVVAFNAHLDTSPETSGAGVKPQVIRGYKGGDIKLPGDPGQVIRVADNPELDDLLDATLVTTDGTTLLGGDDKAGLAIIVEAAAYLVNHPEIVHGPIRVLFTCDEEIGRGVNHVDLDKLGAAVCYTLDGDAADKIDVETFSADLATVTVRGVNIHPSIAKGRMVNAVRAAAEFVSRLPKDQLSPETTEDRQGFIHPYHLDGGVGQVVLKLILRDFETAVLTKQADLLRETANEVEREFPGVAISVDVMPQYRNPADGLVKEPRAAAYAQRAHERLGRTAQLTSIRGGTDGSLLTEKGLPTPNLSTGQHNPHSPLEWVCLEQMVGAVDVLVQLVQVWAQGPDVAG